MSDHPEFVLDDARPDLKKARELHLKYYVPEVPCSKCAGQIYRTSNTECRVCHCIKQCCRSVANNAVHQIIRHGYISPIYENHIGVSTEEFRSFLVKGCRAIGVKIEDYGHTWGIYRFKGIAAFSPSEQKARANRIENLKVKKLHNKKPALANSLQPDLFHRPQ